MKWRKVEMIRSRLIVRWTPASAFESWTPATLDQLGKDEEFFEDVLAASPDLLGLESRRTGIHGPYHLLQQVAMETPSGRSIRPDIVMFAVSGHVIVVEVKRSVNPELRDRAVIAQIIDYASSFASLTEQQCIDLFGDEQHTTWTDCVSTMFPDDPSPDELADVFLQRIQSGNLNLAIACDKVPTGLPEVVSGIASQSTIGFDLDLVEVIPYVRDVSGDAEILFVPSTRMATEIVSRTAVTVTYREGNERPSTTVQTTSVQEVVDNVRKGGRRITTEVLRVRRDYWVSFCKFLQENALDVEPARPTDGASLHVPLGVTGHYVSAFLYGDPPDRIGVRLKASPEVMQAMQEHASAIKQSLGTEIFHPGKLGNPMIVAEQPMDIADKESWPKQHEWLLKTIGQFDETLSPYFPTE